LRQEILSDNFLQNLSGNIALDTGLLIDFLTNGVLADFVETRILKNKEIKSVYIHDYVLTEVFYVICRQKGEEEAERIVNNLEKIAFVVPTSELVLPAGKIKCIRSISLSDCFSCSIGQKYKIPVLFKEEQELIDEKRKRAFDFNLILISPDSINL
jgi:predicted nucleic-acid-binding protein